MTLLDLTLKHNNLSIICRLNIGGDILLSGDWATSDEIHGFHSGSGEVSGSGYGGSGGSGGVSGYGGGGGNG